MISRWRYLGVATYTANSTIANTISLVKLVNPPVFGRAIWTRFFSVGFGVAVWVNPSRSFVLIITNLRSKVSGCCCIFQIPEARSCITCAELTKSNRLKLSKRWLSRHILPDLLPQQPSISQASRSQGLDLEKIRMSYIVKYASSPCTWGGWRSIHAGAITVKPCVCCSNSEKTGHFSTLGKLYANF